MTSRIKELRQEANVLIREGGSPEKSQALGMLRVLNSLSNKTPWFHKADKILHKGYWYAKIKDIPLGDV